MRKYLWLIGIVGLFVLSFWLGSNFLLARFRIKSQFDQQFKISTFIGNVFLFKSGYWGKVREIQITFTPEEQDGSHLVDGDNQILMSSFGCKRKGEKRPTIALVLISPKCSGTGPDQRLPLTKGLYYCLSKPPPVRIRIRKPPYTCKNACERRERHL